MPLISQYIIQEMNSAFITRISHQLLNIAVPITVLVEWTNYWATVNNVRYKLLWGEMVSKFFALGSHISG